MQLSYYIACLQSNENKREREKYKREYGTKQPTNKLLGTKRWHIITSKRRSDTDGSLGRRVA